MAQMTEKMVEMFEKVPVAILATANSNGMPNAVPIGAKKVIDKETILISDQFFNKTLANMKANPRVSLTYWDEHAGYQLKGPVIIETTGSRFEETARWIEEMGKKLGFPIRSKGAVILHIEEIYAIGPGPDAGKRLA